MEIYIKPTKKSSLSERKEVYVEDIAEVFAPDNILKSVKKIKILDINEIDNKNFLITALDLITVIDKAIPGHTIYNVGEIETVLEYSPRSQENNKLTTFCKSTLILIILFVGSCTAIMSFHSDAEIPSVFETYYRIFFNERVTNPSIITIPYSIGISLGIIIFFNHFTKKSITNDPTPIEVQMSLYESDVTNNIIDSLNADKSKSEN